MRAHPIARDLVGPDGLIADAGVRADIVGVLDALAAHAVASAVETLSP